MLVDIEFLYGRGGRTARERSERDALPMIEEAKTALSLMSEPELQAAVDRYAPWYHTVRLTERVTTRGNDGYVPIVNMTLEMLGTLNLRGKRVLDIGCRDGAMCFAAERAGACEVMGIDNDLSTGAVELLIPYFQSRVRMQQLNLYALTPEAFGTFDVVIAAGLLYHLRYPMWGLKLIRDVLAPAGLLVLETAVLVDDNARALLFCPVGAESPYEPSSCTFFNLKGLEDTLATIGFRVLSVRALRHTPNPGGPRPLTLRRRLGRVLAAFRGRDDDWIDRAALVCQRGEDLLNPHLDAYWHDIHRIHSDPIVDFRS
jgi:SAM-dependent methyltransferase